MTHSKFHDYQITNDIRLWVLNLRPTKHNLIKDY